MHFLSVVAGILFSIALFSASLPQLMRYYTMGMMSESDLDIPQWVIFMAMPIGAALLFGYYVRCLIVFFRGHDPFATHGPSGSEL
jgi:TRAP-type C4-dicarboxylate transport system permease small subunit